MEDDPLHTSINRRQALKKAAAVGAAVWAVPAIQSVNMSKAWASVGSWTTEDCYSVDIDIDPYGGVSYDRGTSFRCLSPKAAWVGAGVIGVVGDGSGGWIVSVNIPGARIAEGSAKGRDRDPDAHCNRGTPTAPNTMRFAATTTPKGVSINVRDVELTFCVPAADPAP